EVGKELFGEKFVPLVEFLPADVYLGILERVDLAVLNFQRQQGLGNIFVLIAMGKAVFMQPNTSTYAYFLENGIAVWDLRALSSVSFDQLPVASEERTRVGRSFIAETFS